jgi:hypothetical protein
MGTLKVGARGAASALWARDAASRELRSWSAVAIHMGRRAKTGLPADSHPDSGRPHIKGTYQQELAKLRRTRAAVLQSASDCEDYLAHGDERRTKAREPEPVD